MALRLRHGFHETERTVIAALYWQAFSGKLGGLLGPEDRAIPLIARSLNPEFALVALEDGQLLGVAGFKSQTGGLVDARPRDIAREFGWPGALWRLPLLAMLEKDLKEDVFAMDGIFVAEHARGRGIGRALLDGTKAEALRRNYRKVRLDVINSNPKARALYVREGFESSQVQKIGLLQRIYGFSSVETLVYTFPEHGSRLREAI